MTPDEIQALRHQHRQKIPFRQCNEGCSYCLESVCKHCGDTYPCDVIKVLDAWEAERKAIVTALSHGHHEMYEIVDEIAKVLYGRQ